MRISLCKNNTVPNNFMTALWFYVLVLAVTFGSLASQAALPIADGDGNKLPSLAPMVEEVNPAVVNIATFSKRQEVVNPLLNDPFFRRFFNVPDQRQFQQPRRQRSAGSGVIVDADQGIIMTNFHVIKGADEIVVSLKDGRTFNAEMKGSDPDLDIAILKVDSKDLTDISFADSDELAVGDFVVAIGNPFGLGQTVTTGVVSALGRTGLGIEGYENFIQTDASINPGNSGGALVNLRGELVGINTAIISPAGGNVGIGFAIPVNMAKASMEQILEYGEVRRGLLGIGIQDISPDLRKAFDLDNGQQGVLVTGVNSNSPAEKAGLKPGDVIVAVDGKATASTGQLRSQIGSKRIGERVNLSLVRNGKTKEVKVKIGKPGDFAMGNDKLHKLLEGVRFEDNARGKGIIVAGINPSSRAAGYGLRVGDLITQVNRQEVNSLADLSKALSRGKDAILMYVQRNRGGFYLVIK